MERSHPAREVNNPELSLRQRARRALSLFPLMAVFWPSYALTRLLTVFLTTIRWNRWLPALHARLGLRHRVLFLEPFFPGASGYAYRVDSWAKELRAHGFTTRIRHALGAAISQVLLTSGWTGAFYAVYLLRRLPQCLAAPLYNCVVVRRELLLYNNYGNLFLEQLLVALNPHVVLDFDDDIAAAKLEPRPLTRFGRFMLEAPEQFSESLRLYHRFIAGSEYLRDLLLATRGDVTPDDVIVVPTCVDYEHLRPKQYSSQGRTLTLGWIGTNTNLPLLESIMPALNVLARRHPLRLIVISGRDLRAHADFPVENRRWSLQTQIPDLMEVDIGLMPLYGTRAERGKCGFKLIQYMGLGIVAVGSAVTTNCEIVTDGVDGFLVAPGGDWNEALQGVLDRRSDFARIGAAARRKVLAHYSFTANAPRYVEFMRRACEGQRLDPTRP